jgi:hypothetical protein
MVTFSNAPNLNHLDLEVAAGPPPRSKDITVKGP